MEFWVLYVALHQFLFRHRNPSNHGVSCTEPHVGVNVKQKSGAFAVRSTACISLTSPLLNDPKAKEKIK